jgi:hypothetical protein
LKQDSATTAYSTQLQTPSLPLTRISPAANPPQLSTVLHISTQPRNGCQDITTLKNPTNGILSAALIQKDKEFFFSFSFPNFQTIEI